VPRGLLVHGNPTELREVLTNLLKNSIEALEEPGTITIQADTFDERLRIRVVDTGPGIRPEVLDKLFVPFFTTKGERGTGLGLCLTQQIVERHGGELRIESKVGVGTTASVLLPPARVTAAAAPSSGPESRQGDRDVLVIDDDPDVLSVLCAYLRQKGFSVRSASNGTEGLAEASSTAPDIILSDIAMPGMDGIELCRQLRARLPKIPVVLMSGQASAIEPDRIRSAGAAALLAKPFTMKQVIELISGLAVDRH
jgi:CheY-like chemotaxis protein